MKINFFQIATIIMFLIGIVLGVLSKYNNNDTLLRTAYIVGCIGLSAFCFLKAYSSFTSN